MNSPRITVNERQLITAPIINGGPGSGPRPRNDTGQDDTKAAGATGHASSKSFSSGNDKAMKEGDKASEASDSGNHLAAAKAHMNTGNIHQAAGEHAAAQAHFAAAGLHYDEHYK